MPTPQLIYIVPKLTARGDEHFEAIPSLLKQLQGRCEVIMLVERGEIAAAQHLPFPTFFLPKSNPIRRRFHLWATLRKLGKPGTVTYVRISQLSAIVAALYCKIFHGRSLYWHCGAIRFSPWRGLQAFVDWIRSGIPLQVALKVSDRVVTGTATMRDFYSNEYGIAGEKIRIVANDFDPTIFNPPNEHEQAILRAKLALPAGILILFVHRLSPIRRTALYFPAILRTLARFPTANLVIIGDGPERQPLVEILRGFTEEVQGRCLFLGSKPHREIADYMRAADIFINPSYVEGFPRVVIEAMGCGLPVVSTDAGGTLDLFPLDWRKMVTSRDDPEALAINLAEVLKQPADVRQGLGQELARHAQRFHTDVVATDFLKVISEAE